MWCPVSCVNFRTETVKYSLRTLKSINGVAVNLHGSWICHSFDPFSNTENKMTLNGIYFLFFVCPANKIQILHNECVHFNQPYSNEISAFRFFLSIYWKVKWEREILGNDKSYAEIDNLRTTMRLLTI